MEILCFQVESQQRGGGGFFASCSFLLFSSQGTGSRAKFGSLSVLFEMSDQKSNGTVLLQLINVQHKGQECLMLTLA